MINIKMLNNKDIYLLTRNKKKRSPFRLLLIPESWLGKAIVVISTKQLTPESVNLLLAYSPLLTEILPISIL